MKSYVGLAGGTREVFSAHAEPTPETHGRYAAVIGPFASIDGARIMAAHGRNNPHLQDAGDADRMAAEHHCDTCSPWNFASIPPEAPCPNGCLVGSHRWAMVNA